MSDIPSPSENVNALAPIQSWIDHGFTEDLLLVIPPGARLSPYSALTPAHCGKTPGLPTPEGWVGHRGWTKERVSRETLARRLGILQNAPFSLGLQARHVHALDVDTDDPDFAKTVYTALQPFARRYGLGVRVGKPPGFLVPFFLQTPRHKARLQFVHEITGRAGTVELLGQGQQYVVQGRHPKTGEPYRWHPVSDTPAFLEP